MSFLKCPACTAEVPVGMDYCPVCACPIDPNERIKYFQIARIGEIVVDNTPVLLDRPQRLILQLIPSKAFDTSSKYNLTAIDKSHCASIYSSSFDFGRYEKDSFIAGVESTGIPRSSAYFQIFTNGIIETVDTRVFDFREGVKLIDAETSEKGIVTAVSRYLQIYETLGIDPPAVALICLIGVKGYAIGPKPQAGRSQIDRDAVFAPDIPIDDFKTRNIAKLLKPAFEVIFK